MMTLKKLAFLSSFGLSQISLLSAQAMVGDELPETIGFTQAAPSVPLQNLSEFDYRDLEGQVAVVVYHASW